MIKCEDSDRSFSSLKQQRAHALDSHASSFSIAVQDDSGSQDTIIIEMAGGVYHCPSCPSTFKGKSGCRKHLQGRKCPQKRKCSAPVLVDNVADAGASKDPSDLPLAANSTDSSDMENEEHVSLAPVTMPITAPTYHSNPALEQARKKRGYDDAALYV